MTHQRRYVQKWTAYEAMGIAAMLPGMQHMITLMQRALDDMRATLARVQDRKANYEEEAGEATEATGNPVMSAQKKYWAAMTPKERAAEMRRRGMMGRAKKQPTTGKLTKRGVPAKMHPRDPRHPGHEEYIRKLGKVSKASWANLSPADRDARVAKTLEGRVA